VQFSWRALFTKATPTNYTIRQDFNCHTNERETPKICLTNHKGSISHHITLLVIKSIADKSNFKKPVLWPARAWFNKINKGYIATHVCSYTITFIIQVHYVYICITVILCCNLGLQYVCGCIVSALTSLCAYHYLYCLHCDTWWSLLS